jgi:hypothetical protein
LVRRPTTSQGFELGAEGKEGKEGKAGKEGVAWKEGKEGKEGTFAGLTTADKETLLAVLPYVKFAGIARQNRADLARRHKVLALAPSTRLSLGAGSAWAGEAVWNGDGATGGGCSVVFTAQPWQQSVSDWSGVGCGGRL